MKVRLFARSLIFTVLVIGLIATICVLINVVIYHSLGYGCYWWECAPKRNFTVYDLALPKDLLPPDAEQLVLYPVRDIIGATESVHGVSSGVAIYEVFRFATIKKASEWYQARISDDLFTSTLEDRSKFSRVFDYRSEIADEYFVDCGYVIGEPLYS